MPSLRDSAGPYWLPPALPCRAFTFRSFGPGSDLGAVPAGLLALLPREEVAGIGRAALVFALVPLAFSLVMLWRFAAGVAFRHRRPHIDFSGLLGNVGVDFGWCISHGEMFGSDHRFSNVDTLAGSERRVRLQEASGFQLTYGARARRPRDSRQGAGATLAGATPCLSEDRARGCGFSG